MQSYCLVPGAASTKQVFIMAFQNTPFVRVQPNLDNQTSEMPESWDAKQLVCSGVCLCWCLLSVLVSPFGQV